jgi:hypothetical protein
MFVGNVHAMYEELVEILSASIHPGHAGRQYAFPHLCSTLEGCRNIVTIATTFISYFGLLSELNIIRVSNFGEKMHIPVSLESSFGLPGLETTIH